jgi:hypothetical protein
MKNMRNETISNYAFLYVEWWILSRFPWWEPGCQHSPSNVVHCIQPRWVAVWIFVGSMCFVFTWVHITHSCLTVNSSSDMAHTPPTPLGMEGIAWHLLEHVNCLPHTPTIC